MQNSQKNYIYLIFSFLDRHQKIVSKIATLNVFLFILCRILSYNSSLLSSISLFLYLQPTLPMFLLQHNYLPTFYNFIMQQDPVVDIFEQQLLTDTYDQNYLKQLQEYTRFCYDQIHARQTQNQNEEFDFKDKLHFETLVEETREIIYQCNIELTDIMVMLSLHVLTGTYDEGSLKKNESNSEEDEMKMSCSERKSGKIEECWLRQLKKSLQSFKKTLTLRQVQLTMILFVMQHRNVKDFKNIYVTNYGALGPYIINPENVHKQINLFILEDIFKKEAQFLNQYLDQINKLKSYGEISFEGDDLTKEKIVRMIGRMKILHVKINTITQVFPYACIKDKDDLFSYPLSHHRWQELTASQQIRHIAFADQHTLAVSFEQIRHNLTLINAAMSVIDRQRLSPQQPITRKVVKLMDTALQVIKLALFKGQAQHEANLMMAQPGQILAKQIWNLPQHKIFRELINLSLPCIAFSQVFYLPRVLKEYFIKRYWQDHQVDFPDTYITNLNQYREQLYIKQSYDETIRVRVNSSIELQKIEMTEGDNKNKKKQKSKSFIGIFTSLFMKQAKAPHAIIFHIHGGGFISMSSYIHQTYTRHWTNNLQVPIVSVDYGKAPNYPFPQGLYDCLQAYMWTLLEFKQLYEIYPQKIVIVGDSAGGNLSTALTTLLIMWGLPRPSGLVLVYPALNLNCNQYTPSLLTALTDMILPHTLMKLCQKAYLKDERLKPETDPLISPLLTPPQILQKFPRTQIFVGNKDPFHDDCCRLVQKMNFSKPKNAKLTIFEQFPHGFLQFDLQLLPNEYTRKATKMVEDALRSLLFD